MMVSAGSVMSFANTGAESPTNRLDAAETAATIATIFSMGFLLGRVDVDRLDHIAHVARRLPQRLHRLGFADPVKGAHPQVQPAFSGRLERHRPFPERIAPQVFAQLRLAPCLPAIFRARNFLDALARVKRDA